MIVTRFAPSPTGYLHLGHAYAALQAQAAGARFLLRIEDLDATRCRPEFESAIEEDLHWLGLSWPQPVMHQSERSTAYGRALDTLTAGGFVYPCFCTRKEIAEEVARSGVAPQGPEGPLYPGTCRHLGKSEVRARTANGEAYALRLNSLRAADEVGALSFMEHGLGPNGETDAQFVDPVRFGDVVLARKDAPAAYHLAVIVDDAAQGVTLVTRGNDLFAATHIQRVLQELLGLPEPEYAHHRMLLDEQGRKLSKRDGVKSLRDYRAEGLSPADVIALTSR